MMRHLAAVALLVLAAGSAAPEVPFPADETLRYSVNWPSGLSLGECEMSARLVRGASGEAPSWNFEFRLDAAVPGFVVQDHFASVATPELCSLRLEKAAVHGRRTAKETTVFDTAAGLARRQTAGGGTSEMAIGKCPRDALAFLYHLRHELSQGRLPPPQKIFFGAEYEIRLRYLGTKHIRLGDNLVAADQISAQVKGPVSEHTFELLVGQEEARRPLRITVPFELGSFSMELVP
jgi:hypothetical protein